MIDTIWFWSLIVLISVFLVVWLLFAIYRGIRYEIFQVIGFIFVTLSLSLTVGEYSTFQYYEITASILALVAFSLIFLGLISINRRWVKRRGTANLNKFGNLLFFAYIRHPIGLGLIFVAFSLIFLVNSILSNIFAVMAVIAFFVSSLEKDSHLQKLYGYPYKLYMQRVPRFNIFHGIIRAILSRENEEIEQE